MPSPKCDGCEECGTTLEAHPSLWRKPDPHEFSGEAVKSCIHCGIPAPAAAPSKGEGLDLDAIEARLESIKPGGFDDEWTASLYEENEPQAPDGWIVMGLDACLEASICQVFGGNQDPEAISKFIAAARTDIPTLIAEIRRLRSNLGDNGGSEASPLKAGDLVWEIESLLDAACKVNEIANRNNAGLESGRKLHLLACQIENVAGAIKEWPAIAALKGEPCEPTKSQVLSNPEVLPPAPTKEPK
jgi:hypothetical protein